MSERTNAIVADLERLNDEVESVIDRVTPDEWHATTANEGWPLGYAVRHIANGYAAVLEWVACGRAGEPHISDPEMIHASNAAGLAANGAGRPDEVRALLRDRQQAVARLVHELSDAELDLAALVAASGQQRTVAEVLTTLLAAHTRTHLESICATVGPRLMSVRST